MKGEGVQVWRVNSTGFEEWRCEGVRSGGVRQ